MRVGVFIDTDNFGGAESIVASIATFLAESHHDVIVYHFGNRFLEEACSRPGVETRIVPRRHWYKKTYRLPVFAYHFARILRADGLDLLHSHLFGPIVAGGLACRLAGIPHVGTLHDVYIVQERPIRAYLLRLVHALGTELVCVGEPMARFYASAAHVPLDAIRVIENGVDLSRFGAEGRRDASGQQPVLIMVGRLDSIKRHDLLLETLARSPNLPPWRLEIVGDGPEREALLSLCGRLNLAQRVEFLGQRDDVPDLLANADVFLLISDSEGMSLSLIEALASGLPSIATKAGNNSELVRDGWNGCLIDPGSSVQLEGALEKLLEDRELRLSFGVNSREMSAGLDLHHTLSAYLRLYERLTTASK